MKLRGIEFGPVWGASGVQGFFGEGYWYHKYLKMFFPLGFSFKDMTFVAKTTTLYPRVGNMPLQENGISPKEYKPACIKTNFWQGAALNAVGLSGPGLIKLLKSGRWQSRVEPFFISFMAVGKTVEERLWEAEKFVKIFGKEISKFQAHLGIQINFSCPNVGLNQTDLEREALSTLDIFVDLHWRGWQKNLIIIPKLNALIPIATAKIISEHPACDALCVSNTIPWGKLPERINWKNIFGSETSPLADLGGGGLSGAPLLPIVCDWIKQAREASISLPINAGGGIMEKEDVQKIKEAGANSISIGTVAMLRPWRVLGIIKEAYRLLAEN